MDLNVGGVAYSTSLETLTREPDSLFTKLFSGPQSSTLTKDSQVSISSIHFMVTSSFQPRSSDSFESFVDIRIQRSSIRFDVHRKI